MTADLKEFLKVDGQMNADHLVINRSRLAYAFFYSEEVNIVRKKVWKLIDRGEY